MTISAEEIEEARDQAANFVLDKLADALGVKDWTPCDGTETWEGDVAGSVYSILRQARVLDPDTDELATSRIAALEAQLTEAVAALEPFARVGRIIDGPFGPALFAKDDQAFKNGCTWRENGEDKFLSWGDFRRAAASALEQKEIDDGE